MGKLICNYPDEFFYQDYPEVNDAADLEDEIFDHCKGCYGRLPAQENRTYFLCDNCTAEEFGENGELLQGSQLDECNQPYAPLELIDAINEVNSGINEKMNALETRLKAQGIIIILFMLLFSGCASNAPEVITRPVLTDTVSWLHLDTSKVNIFTNNPGMFQVSNIAMISWKETPTYICDTLKYECLNCEQQREFIFTHCDTVYVWERDTIK